MNLGIDGRKAIVCGSSRGLGRACAIALAEAGVEIVVNGIDAQRVRDTADWIGESTGARVHAVAADVTTPEGQRALLAMCPQPDILINNAGGPPPKDFRELDREAMLNGLTANMIAGVELIQATLDGMTERRFGRIVNITSMSVKMPIPGLDLSSGARAGLTAFLAGITRSVTHANVTINNLLPGAFDTDRLHSGVAANAKRKGLSHDEVLANRVASIPARRLGNPKEFGAACAFLCSANSGYITGQNLLIDGGVFPGAF